VCRTPISKYQAGLVPDATEADLREEMESFEDLANRHLHHVIHAVLIMRFWTKGLAWATAASARARTAVKRMVTVVECVWGTTVVAVTRW
jgi:phage/plasmid primase-like uncharacterized protein